jgi:hypothetical protein
LPFPPPTIDSSHIYFQGFRPDTNYVPYWTLALLLVQPLTDQGLTTYLIPTSPSITGTSYEDDSNFVAGHITRDIESGYLSTTGPGSAPEPSTSALVAGAIALIACVSRHRKSRWIPAETTSSPNHGQSRNWCSPRNSYVPR